ncbi:DUF134 domain-containing protein, partial [Desulfovibrio sp.]|uniref:DUF134 domain-containing protein n=1 Tax=Desulfovibrio sp. TaxID=885 RepID=UPI0030789354
MAAQGRSGTCTMRPRKASTRCAEAGKSGGIRERGLTWPPQGLCSIVQNVRKPAILSGCAPVLPDIGEIMPRPRQCRYVATTPSVTYFKPRGIPMTALEEVCLGVEELEALRLADLEGLTGSEAA